MEDWNLGHYFILSFMAILTVAAIKISIAVNKKERTIYDKHAHSKPRDGDNT